MNNVTNVAIRRGRKGGRDPTNVGNQISQHSVLCTPQSVAIDECNVANCKRFPTSTKVITGDYCD